MAKNAYLVLSDKSVYKGISFGSESDSWGEVVFNTSMIGYQEILTDPSYAGQIVMPTFPLIGNYGVNSDDNESSRIQLRGFIVREECSQPSHYLSNQTLHEYLYNAGIPGISGVDTRAITRKLRSSGVMMGMITHSDNITAALTSLQEQPDYGTVDFVRQVTTQSAYQWQWHDSFDSIYKIIVLDCGLKYNILRLLKTRGCNITIVPCTTSADDILSLSPDGILLSPGPGNPVLLDYITSTVKELVGKKPMMGICLGCQLISRVFGGKTYKLKFGHRGGNHPVKELTSGRVHITAQNHGYAIDSDSLANGLVVTHINLNDNTVEGVAHRDFPIFAVQYHAEDSPGPNDNRYLFDKFLEMIDSVK